MNIRTISHLIALGLNAETQLKKNARMNETEVKKWASKDAMALIT